MRLFTTAAAFLAFLTLVGTADAGKGQKKKNKPISGTVVEVKADEMVLKTQAKKGAPVEEKTIKLSGETKYARITGKKKALQSAPATAQDVTKGASVTVSLKDGKADAVTIRAAKKAKKAK
jgi:hypothetical protein